MAAELGQTDDPRALVPGSPETIEGNAETLTQHGQRTETVGNGLGKIDVVSWAGQAAEGFRTTFAEEPPRWRKATDALNSTASTLTGFADTLRWAQSQAGEAIELWNQGEAATSKAKADHQNAVTQANAAAAGGPSPAHVGPFVDPGEQLRQQARELLDRARGQLAEAGSGAANAVKGLFTKSEGDAKGKGPNADWAWVNPKAAIDGEGLGSNKYGTTNFDGDPKKAATPGDFSVGGGIKGYANLVEGELTGNTTLAGAVDLDGKASGNIGVNGSAVAAITQDGAKLGVAGQAGLSGALEGNANYGIVGAHAKGTAFAGAEGEASITAGKNGINGQAGAFAGGKVGGSVGADVGGLGAGATAEGWAGAGAEAEFKLGKGEDGKWHIGGQAGVGLGLGGKVGGEITVDPGKIVDTVGDAGKAISKLNPFD